MRLGRRASKAGAASAKETAAPPTCAEDEKASPSHRFTPVSFEHATDIADLVAERRRLQRNFIAMRAITAILLVAAIAVASFPLVLQFKTDRELAATTATTAREVAGWPYPEAENALKAARVYNERLAATGQPVLGEASDPFSSTQGGSHASGEDSAASKDEEYQSLLDAGNGIMGTVKVPKQSIALPIYHGTSEEVLASGAGHLYGTSLPVGGESTHAVITGHRGLVEALMFTRIDEMREGDFFYIEVMGETLGYKVDRISVILPDDTEQLKIVPGEDRVTLMTCTPYGVNTHRLLVSGHRVAIPIPAPEPEDVHDGRSIAIMVTAGVFGAGMLATVPIRRRNMLRIMRHAAFWPYQKHSARGGANDIPPSEKQSGERHGEQAEERND